jgi:hypothetical protein
MKPESDPDKDGSPLNDGDRKTKDKDKDEKDS